MVLPLRSMFCRFLTKLHIILQAVTFLGILRTMSKKPYMQVSRAVVFIIAKTWKQLRRPLVCEWLSVVYLDRYI
jgi:hypothetical protein